MQDGPRFRRRLEAAKRRGLGHRLVRAARLFDEAALAELRKQPGFEGVRSAHLGIMPHLDLEGTRLVELARRMEVSKQAVGQLVDDLEELGLVAREPDPEDRRAKKVMFTDAGRDALLVGLGALERVGERLSEALGTKRVEALVEGLEQLSRALED